MQDSVTATSAATICVQAMGAALNAERPLRLLDNSRTMQIAKLKAIALCSLARVFLVPVWAILLTLGTITASGFVYSYRITRSTRRLKAGLCLRCGYNLQASKVRCPECGTAIPTANVYDQ